MNYVGSGGATFGGCATITKLVYIAHEWSVGELLYSKQKAAKGIMEPVVIKQILFNDRYVQTIPIYRDTLNYLWNEGDLVTEEDAVALIAAYREWYSGEAWEAQCSQPQRRLPRCNRQ